MWTNLTCYLSKLVTITSIAIVIALCSSTNFACPPPPPETLRVLLQTSHLAVAGITGKSSVTSKRGEHMYRILTELHILTVYKGEITSNVISYYHWEYKATVPDANTLAGGRLGLFFLNIDKNNGEYIVRKVKELNDSNRDIYLARVDELVKILASDKEQLPQMVEWLVRCAEDPATREEAYQEFIWGINRKSETTTIKTADLSKPLSFLIGVFPEVKPINETESLLTTHPLVKQLTAAQKDYLINILLNSNKITIEDRLFIELAKEWQDQRVIPLIIDQLHDIDDMDLADELVKALISLLDNDQLTTIKEEYDSISEIVYNEMTKEPEWAPLFQEAQDNDEKLSATELTERQDLEGRYQEEHAHRITVRSKEKLSQLLNRFDEIYLAIK